VASARFFSGGQKFDWTDGNGQLLLQDRHWVISFQLISENNSLMADNWKLTTKN
jgi:hypothetical protein